MNTEIMTSLFELGLALFIGIGTVFLTQYIFTKIYNIKKDEKVHTRTLEYRSSEKDNRN